ncbi:hypothetical protein C7G83_11960 [Siccibacter turicensis]|uniref:Uncharacterized protein n=1 Tax=Siccibacter turicensis TaxID=357233 RepID=A0A2P8VJX6_9ENTR|nr:hypothetical protein C7G83_11960 [Siccibacter turicensis]
MCAGRHSGSSSGAERNRKPPEDPLPGAFFWGFDASRSRLKKEIHYRLQTTTTGLRGTENVR